MDTKILELLLRKLNEREEAIGSALRHGTAKDYAEYRESCGVVRGLGLARMEINDLLRSIREKDDE
jgi:hypothetical protein